MRLAPSNARYETSYHRNDGFTITLDDCELFRLPPTQECLRDSYLLLYACCYDMNAFVSELHANNEMVLRSGLSISPEGDRDALRHITYGQVRYPDIYDQHHK